MITTTTTMKMVISDVVDDADDDDDGHTCVDDADDDDDDDEDDCFLATRLLLCRPESQALNLKPKSHRLMDSYSLGSTAHKTAPSIFQPP